VSFVFKLIILDLIARSDHELSAGKETFMKDWQEEYVRKQISAEEAANLVKSGDRVVFTAGRETFAIGLAHIARKEELKGVKIWGPSPGYDLAGDASKNYIGGHGVSSWYDDTPGMKNVREITLKYQPGTDKPWRSKYYTLGWVVMTLFHEGMTRAGKNLTPDSFVQALESIKDFDTQGLCGSITFSPTDHKGFSSCKLFKADPTSGKLVPITGWRNPQKFISDRRERRKKCLRVVTN
jgi:ABC-type branched-subunit amino acid transport system substrate-binding protein